MEEHFAIASCEERVLAWSASFKFLPQLDVVVDLPVYAKDNVLGHVEEWLITTVRIDNGETLVGNNALTSGINSAPVRATVAQELCQVYNFLTLCSRRSGLQAEEGEDPTHLRNCA
jgi:hypothetical protein